MIVSDVAPPAPYAEVVPVGPFPGAVWIGGYWGWAGGRHNWVAGPLGAGRPGYAWRPTAGRTGAGAGTCGGGGLLAAFLSGRSQSRRSSQGR